MKIFKINHLIIAVLFFSSIDIIFSQKNYNCKINRYSNSKYQLIDQNGNTLASMSEDTLILEQNNKFIYSRGKGWKRDKKRERKRNKRYIISQTNDTLFTIRTKLKEFQFNNKYYHYEKIKKYWKIFSNNDTLIWIRYSFDDNFFRFSIQSIDSKEYPTENIVRFITPYLKEIYLKEIAFDYYSGSGEDDNIWLILFTSFQVN